VSVNNSYLLGLFSSSSSSSASANMFSVLSSAYTAEATAASSAASSSQTPAPTPPWDEPSSTVSTSTSSSSGSGSAALTPSQAAAVQQALAGQPIINPSAAQLNVSSSNAAVNSDYQNLFALYQGLSTLYGLTQQMSAPGTGSLQASEIEQAFNNGMSEVSSFLQGNNFQTLTVAQGTVSSSDTANVAVSQGSSTYVGQNIVQGSSADAESIFQGPVQFSMNVANSNGTSQTINFNLDQMGSETRSLTNVVDYLNSQLAAAGVSTRFATQRTAGTDQTETVGSNTVDLGTSPDQFALVLNGVPNETVSFSAPATADAVYVTQGSGAGGAAGQQLLKYQADATEGGTPPAAQAQPQDTNVTSGEAWQDNLPSTVTGVQATAAGPNGSVYVLANVDGTTSGQPIQGAGDVALMEYDSAGNLQFTQTLGAAVNASGLGLAVSADGEVAVTGQVTGSLTPGDGLSSTAQSAFVSVYSNTGDQLWSQTIPATSGSQGNSVAFGANDSVYVVGQTSSPILGANGSTSANGTTSFLAGFSSTGAQQFVNQFGSTTGDNDATGVTVSGNQVLVGGTENGSAVVRSYTIGANGAATAGATENLGSLNGGSVAGIALNNGQLVVAGTTHNTGLSAGATTAAGGAGSNAFVATLDPSLMPTSTNSIAYYQSQGGTTVTAVSVANGNVYIAGQTGPTLTDPAVVASGSSASSSSSSSSSGISSSSSSSTSASTTTSSQVTTGQAGYIAEINPTTGQVGFTTSLSGEAGIAAPTSITVATGGASVLDQLGLPQGTINQTAPSDVLTTATSLQPGDSFYIQGIAGQSPTQVTIQAGDTLSTLASRIAQASDFRLTATVNSSTTSQSLTLTATDPNEPVQILSGPTGENALPGLGLSPGLIQSSSSSSSSSSTSAQTTFGLDLSSTLSLDSTTDISQAAAQIQYAMSEVQSAYQALVTANTPKSAQPAASSGTVPAYLQAQIANYQAGLARLTGSG
jgi:hypothetical protein